jgi:hypothetical protein
MTVETRLRKPPRRFAVVRPWPIDEVSTRNCRHCLAPDEGIYVRCRKGHPMTAEYDRHRRRLTYNGVVRVARLVAPCRGCRDFDNDWR